MSAADTSISVTVDAHYEVMSVKQLAMAQFVDGRAAI